MDHFQIEVSKVNEPADLLMIEGMGGAEVSEIFMVSEDLYKERGPVKVVSPGLQGMDDGKEFSVIDVIVSFCQGERFGEVGTGVPLAVPVGLQKDGAGSILGGVGGDGEGCGEVQEVKDWFQQEQGFEGVKSSLASGDQFQGKFFLVRSMRGRATFE